MRSPTTSASLRRGTFRATAHNLPSRPAWNGSSRQVDFDLPQIWAAIYASFYALRVSFSKMFLDPEYCTFVISALRQSTATWPRNKQAAGYNPQVWRDMLEKRAEQERYLVGLLDIEPKYRQGRLRDGPNNHPPKPPTPSTPAAGGAGGTGGTGGGEAGANPNNEVYGVSGGSGGAGGAGGVGSYGGVGGVGGVRPASSPPGFAQRDIFKTCG